MGEKFNNDLTVGKQGEDKIYTYLSSLSGVSNVINVSDDAWFQQFDIDFLVQYEDLSISKIEVKTDLLASKTGNMVYELFSNKIIGTQGCFEKTQSDLIYYYLPNTSYLFVFDTISLRVWIKENSDKLSLIDMGDCAQGYLFPLKYIKEIALFRGKI